jgi:transcriptional regulator with XRE-family HTH domain
MIVPVADKDPRRQFGELVQRARVGLELTHHDLGDRCGVPQSTVKAWEAGEEVPRGREWARIKGVLRNLRAAGLVWQAALRVGHDQLTTEAEEQEAIEADEAIEDEQAWVNPLSEALGEDPRTSASSPEVPPLQDPRKQTTFGAALRIARLNIGITQDELGQLLDVVGTTISAWETGSNTPVLDNWTKLVNALPELRDCTPPGVQNIRQPGRPSGPFYPRAQTNPGNMLATIVDRPPEIPRPLVTPAPSGAAAEEIAAAGVAYANALVEQRKAQTGIERAKAELAIAHARLAQADNQIKMAQATLIRLVDKLHGGS